MKFSYSFIKKLVPGLKSKAELIKTLNMHAFETEGGSGDILNISIPPNRYSDAASHWGIAREAAAILNLKFQYKEVQSPKIHRQSREVEPLKIKIKDKALCPRYIAGYFENIKVKPSPLRIKKILRDCGLRPVNNVVDIMNYVMLETGQPLHAFDADKVKDKSIVIRKAKRDESIVSIDGARYKLNPQTLVIADSKNPLAIAGIKGGKSSEVTLKTRRIIVESANFEGTGIYRSSKLLNLSSDASIRFSHGIHPALAALGFNRAEELLKKEGARAVERFDSWGNKSFPKRMLKLDIEELNGLIGLNLDFKTAALYLKRLGFKIRGKIVEIPILRADIETFEDLAEEVVRIYGYNKLKPRAPQIFLYPSESEEMLVFRYKIKKLLVGFGVDEVYGYSFFSEKDARKFKLLKYSIEIQNPISQDWSYLRPSLLPGLIRAAQENAKKFDAIRLFEIGRVFRWKQNKIQERNSLGIIISLERDESIFELKGLIDGLLKGLGVVDFVFESVGGPDKSSWIYNFVKDIVFPGSFLRLRVDDEIIGWLGKSKQDLTDRHTSFFEIDLEKLLLHIEEEKEFKPLSKYPSVMRDISLLVRASVKIGDIIQEIQLINQRLIEDVDLIDEYRDPKWNNQQSITLRIVFQSDEKTLTSREVDREMEKIVNVLEDKFGAQVR